MAAGRDRKIIACWLAALALCLSAILPSRLSEAEDSEVDLALVLAIDCSFSVDQREFALQMEGLARAFMRDDVKKAIAQGQRQRIAVMALQWSDDESQALVLPWTVIRGDDSADALGRRILRIERQFAGGGTSISAALKVSSSFFDSAPKAERRVIDVSSDGRNNSGPPVAPVRDRVVAQGITINGLTIENEWPTLHVYFENHVTGGNGAFVVPANDYDAYGEAIHRKLLREITGPGIT